MTNRALVGLLLVGMAAGAAAALWQVVTLPARGSVQDAAATVNGVAIGRGDLELALASLAADRRAGALREGDRAHVLERLIDEELLVQRGVELGLHLRDRRVRGDLVAAVIASIGDAAAAEEPTAAELGAFFVREAGRFAAPVRYRVQVAFFAGADASARAAAALAQQDWSGDPLPLPLPAGALSPATLRQYLGAPITEAIAALEEGATSDPLPHDDGVYIIKLLQKSGGELPTLQSVESEVRAAYRREAGDRALREFLQDARRRAVIERP